MLNWLKRRCPVDAREKAWIETRMQSLCDVVGSNRLLNTVVAVPTDEFAPDPWTGDHEDVRKLVERLADQMNVRPPTIAWDVSGDDSRQADAHPLSDGTIRLSPQQVTNVWSLSVFLIRTLVQQLVPQGQLAQLSGSGLFWFSDLLAVHCGLGVIAAHAAQEEICGSCCSTSTKPRSGLPDRMLGYALAQFAWLRKERKPQWKSAIGADVLVPFENGLGYLIKTSDSLIDHETISRPPDPSTPEQLIHQLATGSPSARVAALWDLRDSDFSDPVVMRVNQCLHDRSPLIREEASRTLTHYGSSASAALPDLLDLFHDPTHSVRAAAAMAVGSIKENAEEVIPELSMLLDDPNVEVVRSAALAVQQYQDEGAAASGALLKALRAALVRCDYGMIELVARSLAAVDPDPLGHLMTYLENDPELKEQAMQLLSRMEK